ncbi:K(+)-transporting ATPase subunit F [Luteolibacter yonseiensis]|uniref:K(+)-transporting ATPase subunit F n=1 Tax=Luteolibacter yonseiensis TaxID=1144680 RepID=A0A934VDN9_9BACT|nr:K(+)-transporting ATPase subunit F [Luteolibacter yonseiensis]MBK1818330.1 K(+)-transporting ATPase subunit F [Luteolibacter yonseiensis]
MPASARPSDTDTSMETIIIALIALFLIGYLVVAMIHPEKF